MQSVFETVLNLSLSGSWAIVLVLAARLLLRKAPARFRYLLWGVVLLRLLCPVSPESPVSLLPRSLRMDAAPASPVAVQTPAQPQPAGAAQPGTQPSGAAQAAQSESAGAAQSDTQPSGTAQADPQSAGAAQSDQSQPAGTAQSTEAAQTDPQAAGAAQAVPRQAARPGWRQAAPAVLRAAWLSGVLLLLGRSLWSLRKLRQRLSGAVPLRDNIWLSGQIDTAFVLGVSHPRIYLPSALSGEEQAYILLHEQTHIRRRDPLWKLLGSLALCVHWFNPLVWLALRCAERDMELSCDEAVLARLGPGIRQAYASSLLRMAAAPQAGAAFGGGSTKARILNVLQYKKPKFVATLAGAAAVGLLACGLLTNPVHAGLKSLDGQYAAKPVAFDFLTNMTDIPGYTVRDGRLYETNGGVAYDCGALQPFDIRSAAYTELFPQPFFVEETAWRALTENTRQAWRTDSQNLSLLLQQKDGSLYLGCNDFWSHGDWQNGGGTLRFLFRLTQAQKTEPLLWPQTYYVGEIAYQSPLYAFGYTLQTAPVYTVLPGTSAPDWPFRLERREGDQITRSSVSAELSPADLAFETLFPPDDSPTGIAPAEISRNAARIWHLQDRVGTQFLILMQDGRLLLAHMTNGGIIRWLFVLTDAPTPESSAAPDDSAVPAPENGIPISDLTDPYYQEAYNTLLSYRRDGFEEMTVTDFRRMLAPNADQANARLAEYSRVVPDLPADDPNAAYFQITLNATCGEICSDVFDWDYTYFFSLIEQRHPAAPLTEEEALLLAEDPRYELNVTAQCTVTYTLHESVTVGARDRMLQGLQAYMRSWLASLSDDELKALSKMELEACAQQYLDDTPHEGMEIWTTFLLDEEPALE